LGTNAPSKHLAGESDVTTNPFSPGSMDIPYWWLYFAAALLLITKSVTYTYLNVAINLDLRAGNPNET
tara:strand:+ start:129 stop:332 length:204 start_codon:yes stop_codon:yes gene_type:complete